MPALRIGLIAPDALLDDKAFIRIHNKAAKDALRYEAVYHWKKRLPGHFQATARAKYGYKERRPKYKAIKMRQGFGRTDLVRSGETRDSIIQVDPTIRAGGRAVNEDGSTGQLKLSMSFRLPFGLEAQAAVKKRIDNERKQLPKSGRHAPKPYTSNRPGVTIEQMKSEIAAITADEAKEIAASYGPRYTKFLNAALATRPKIRKRYVQANFNPF